MKVFFKRAEENELRMKFEKGKITEATLYYKDSKGVRKGIEELKKRTLYKQQEVIEAVDFREMTTEEITALLESDPELEAKARLIVGLKETFESMTAEQQHIAIGRLKEKYPEMAKAMSKLVKTKSPTCEATQAGRATNQAQ